MCHLQTVITYVQSLSPISWDFLLSVLKIFNFGESIINWVKVFYNNISSALIQGGNLLPIHTTCVLVKLMFSPESFAYQSNSSKASFRDFSLPSKINDVSSANCDNLCF
jgi:hypothetical protein